MMHDYWHRNEWFSRGFDSGARRLRALAEADEGTENRLSPPTSASASGNEDPSERANGLADRRGSAPGLEAPTDTPEPSPFPHDLIKEEAE